MSLLTDLPAAANIGTSDYILIDTGSQNKKLQISSFYADTSHPGLIRASGTQELGAEFMIKRGHMYFDAANATASPGLVLRSNLGANRLTLQHNNTARVARFICFSQDSNAIPLSNYEVFDLPPTDLNRSTNASYSILTTKSVTLNETDKNNALDSLGIHKASFSSTKTITLPNSYRGLLIITNTSTNDNGMYIITTTGVGAVITKAISAASNITIDTTANTLKLTPSSGTRTVCLIDISGASTGW